MNAPTARELRDRLRPHTEAIVSQIAPAARKQGNRFVLGSIAGEAGYSLHINRRGDWIDRANPSDSGDILALIREVACGGDSKAAYRWALDFLGEEITSRRREVAVLVETAKPKHETLSMSGRLREYSYKEIAKELGRKEATMKTQLNRMVKSNQIARGVIEGTFAANIGRPR